MTTATYASPIEKGFATIKALIQRGRTKVRALSIGGHQDIALKLADRLTSIEAFEIGDIEDMPLTQAVALLADLARRVEDGIDACSPEPPAPAPAPEPEPEWLPIDEAAKRLHVTKTAIYNWVQRGKVPTQPDPHRKNGHLICVAQAPTVRRKRHMPTQAKPCPPQRQEEAPKPSIGCTESAKIQQWRQPTDDVKWWHPDKFLSVPCNQFMEAA